MPDDLPLPDFDPVEAAPESLETIDYGILPSLLGYALRRAQLAVFQDFHRHCVEFDIRPAQYSVLTLLRHNPGLQQSRVADALGIKRANFVALFATLEMRGLVARERLASDRRAFALTLTDDGHTLLDRLDGVVAAHDAGFIERIGRDKQAALLGWLRVLAERSA